LIGLIW
jgi:hypothetical protein